MAMIYCYMPVTRQHANNKYLQGRGISMDTKQYTTFFYFNSMYLQSVIIHSANGWKGEVAITELGKQHSTILDIFSCGIQLGL
jgi:hypothetical protein